MIIIKHIAQLAQRWCAQLYIVFVNHHSSANFANGSTKTRRKSASLIVTVGSVQMYHDLMHITDCKDVLLLYAILICFIKVYYICNFIPESA